jgi:hypothetical protein
VSVEADDTFAAVENEGRKTPGAMANGFNDPFD